MKRKSFSEGRLLQPGVEYVDVLLFERFFWRYT